MMLKSEASRRKSSSDRPNIILSQSMQGEQGGAPETDDPEALQRQAELGIIQALGDVLLEKREEAIQHRANLGIELDWQEDEEFYDAKDRANPEGETNVGQKPISPDGGPIGTSERKPARSTVFIPITRPYVDAAHARVSDMLLPNDDPNWSLNTTPVQDEAALQPPAAVSQPTPVAAVAGSMVAGQPPQMPGPGFEPPAGASAQPPAAPPPMPMGVAQTNLSVEEQAAEEATKIITDWLIECQWHAEVRKMIENGARIGTGVLKGPVPEVRTVQKYVKDPDTGQRRLIKIDKMVPVTRSVNPRNCFPDPAGGEDIQKGSYHWEFDQIGARALHKLKKDPTYIPELIDQVLKEGPKKDGSSHPDTTDFDSMNLVGVMYPIWYFYGDVDREVLMAAGVPEEDFPDEEMFTFPAMVVMVNDTVIKATLTPMDEGGFPYDYFPWQRRQGMPWGRGIARQVRTPQRMLNAAVRSMMDNAGLTSGPIFAVRRKWIEPITGSWNLTPRMGFYMTDAAPDAAKIQDAISFENIQSNVNEVNLIIDKALKFAEDATGLPMLMQGQQGEATTTATGMTILNNNGSTVLRRIARTFDDCITEPHIRRYYYWLMSAEGNDDAKGDFQIDARGSTYLVDRDLQAQNLNMLYPLLVQHPDVHPGRLAEEVAMANRLPIQRIFLTEAEKKQRDSQPPQKPEAIQIAEIRAQVDMERLDVDKADKMRKAQIEEGKLQAQVEATLGQLAKDLQINDNDGKLQLAIEVLRQHANRLGAQEQRQHDAGERGIDRQHERTSAIEERNAPPTEPAGRAPNGAAYTS
jgi:hypothetical protein